MLGKPLIFLTCYCLLMQTVARKTKHIFTFTWLVINYESRYLYYLNKTFFSWPYALKRNKRLHRTKSLNSSSSKSFQEIIKDINFFFRNRSATIFTDKLFCGRCLCLNHHSINHNVKLPKQNYYIKKFT